MIATRRHRHRRSVSPRLRRPAALLAGAVALAAAGAARARLGAGDDSILGGADQDHPALSSSARGESHLGRPPEARRTSGSLPAALAAVAPAVAPPPARPVARVSLRPGNLRPGALAARSPRGPPHPEVR